MQLTLRCDPELEALPSTIYLAVHDHNIRKYLENGRQLRSTRPLVRRPFSKRRVRVCGPT